MLRFRVLQPSARQLLLLRGARFLTLPSDTRDVLTKHLSSVKEESKGQGLDLADMNDTMKMAAQSLQDAMRKADIQDAQFKGKMTTLSASLKVYNTRLANLQNEARSLQADVDGILKLMWGTESPQGDKFSTPPSSAADDQDPEGFGVEPPPIAEMLSKKPPVETVEAERVDPSAKPASQSSAAASEEIEVEAIEIETDDDAAAAKPAQAQPDEVESMKITDMTKELYEQGVNFSDCLDAKTLRQRYRDYKSGRISPGVIAGKTASQGSQTNTEQPRMPQRSSHQSTNQQPPPPPPPPPHSSQTGLTQDPYPNAQRKMVDPMKFVWQVKQEVASEKGIDPAAVDLWSGKMKLDDQKRLYDYPSIQSYPIEVRQKGDIPS